MRFSALVTAGTLALLPGRSDAQVSGAIIIGGGPVRGAVVVGTPVVVERHPRVIVVERYHRHKHRHHRFERRAIYWDRHYDRYYDGYRPGLIRLDVFFGGGRYYRDYDDDWRHRRVRGREYRNDHRDWDRDRDRDRRDRDWDRDRRDRDRDRRDRDRDRDRRGN
jgi:hypothetical protein